MSNMTLTLGLRRVEISSLLRGSVETYRHFYTYTECRDSFTDNALISRVCGAPVHNRIIIIEHRCNFVEDTVHILTNF